jgi:hypothetical protein
MRTEGERVAAPAFTVSLTATGSALRSMRTSASAEK